MILPPEIIDTVLDHLHSDKDTLQACALTCKTWARTCRYHLFNTITLSPPDVVAFLKFADASLQDLADLVRCLSVPGRSANTLYLARVAPVAPQTIRLKHHLRDLTSLKLSEMFWGVLPADQKYLLSNLPSITHLELHRVSFDNTHSMLQLICTFKALKTLTLVNWAMLSPQCDIQRFLTTAPKLSQQEAIHVRLDKLNLDMPRSIMLFMEWLMVQDPCPYIQLDCLRLGPLHDHSLLASPCIRRLMESGSTTVNNLQIKSSNIPYEPQAKTEYLREFVEALRYQQIHTLSFDLILLSPPPDNTFDKYTLDIISGILTSISWCRPQFISLSFVITRWESIKSVDWSEMLHILMQPQFEDLRQIRIAVYSVGVDDNRTKLVEAVAEGAFAPLSARGLLSFEFCDEMEGRYY